MILNNMGQSKIRGFHLRFSSMQSGACRWFCDLIPGAPHKCRSVAAFCFGGSRCNGARNAELPTPNVGGEAGPTASHQARAGENVQRTTGPGLVACRWASPRPMG